MSRRRRRINGSTAWYAADALKLNGVLPSFVHDYYNNRYYTNESGATDYPLKDTIRTGAGMMHDSAGRLCWCPMNLLQNTDSFGTGWTLSGATMVLAGIASPFGTAYKLVEDTSSGLHANQAKGAAIVTGETYTVSAVIKAAERGFSFLALSTYFPTTAIRIDLTTGSVATATGTPLNAGAEYLGDGWWRAYFTLVATGSGSSSNHTFVYASVDGVWGSRTYLGDGVSGIYVAAPKLELTDATSPNPYIASGASPYYGLRIDYDPETLEKRGALIEADATNLHVLSETSNPADWYTGAVVAATYIGDVYGARNATRLTTTSSGGLQFSYVSASAGFAPTANVVHSESVYVRRGNHDIIQLTTSAAHCDAFINYNFATSTITREGGADVVVGSSHAQQYADGWVRLQYAYTAVAVPAIGPSCVIGFIATDTASRLSGGAPLGAYVDTFGHQTEVYPVATSYIPTHSAATTRIRDWSVVTPLGTWFDQTKGTWYFDYFCNDSDAINTRRFLSVDDSTSQNRMQIARATTRAMSAFSSIAGVNSFSPSSSTANDFARSKTVAIFGAGGKYVATNGGTVGYASVAPPNSGLTHAWIGVQQGYSNQQTPHSWLREVRYYPDDTASGVQLQEITT